MIAALILAYVISPIINFIEQRIIARLFARHGKTQSVRCKKLVRALLILLTYVAMLFALYGLIATLIPELFSSITNIVSNFSNYANNIQDFATKVLANYPEMQQTADQYISMFSAKLSNWLTNDLMPMLRTFLLNLSGQLVNMVTFFPKHSAWRDRCNLHAVQQGKLHCQAGKKQSTRCSVWITEMP